MGLAGALALTIIGVLALPDNGIHTLAELKAQLKPGQLSMLYTKE